MRESYLPRRTYPALVTVAGNYRLTSPRTGSGCAGGTGAGNALFALTGGQNSFKSYASKGRMRESYLPRRTYPALVTVAGNYRSAPNSFHYKMDS